MRWPILDTRANASLARRPRPCLRASPNFFHRINYRVRRYFQVQLSIAKQRQIFAKLGPKSYGGYARAEESLLLGGTSPLIISNDADDDLVPRVTLIHCIAHQLAALAIFAPPGHGGVGPSVRMGHRKPIRSVRISLYTEQSIITPG